MCDGPRQFVVARLRGNRLGSVVCAILLLHGSTRLVAKKYRLVCGILMARQMLTPFDRQMGLFFFLTSIKKFCCSRPTDLTFYLPIQAASFCSNLICTETCGSFVGTPVLSPQTVLKCKTLIEEPFTSHYFFIR